MIAIKYVPFTLALDDSFKAVFYKEAAALRKKKTNMLIKK